MNAKKHANVKCLRCGASPLVLVTFPSKDGVAIACGNCGLRVETPSGMSSSDRVATWHLACADDAAKFYDRAMISALRSTYADPSHEAWLREEAARRGCSMAQVIRDLIVAERDRRNAME